MKNILLPLFILLTSCLKATPAPNFIVTDSDGQKQNLYQNYINQDKLVVLEAFFIACPPCNTHAPLVKSLYEQVQAAYPGKVEFMLLSTQNGDLNTNVAQYKTSKGFTMPAVGSDGGSLTALQPYTSNQFGLFYGTPTFIVIAPGTGEVHFDIRGNSASQTIALLEAKIAELVSTPPPPPVVCNLKNVVDVGLSGVDLKVSAIGAALPYDTTLSAAGSYSVSNIAALNNVDYSIVPSKDDNPLNGLTTYDLVLISKHILGIEPLSCDWQQVAADVNCSGSITTLDIVTARKVILGILLELPCKSWRFIPDSIVTTNGNCTDFIGVKMGDVNGWPCVQANGPIDERSTLSLSANDQLLQAGDRVLLEISCPENIDLQGFQGSLQVNQENISVTNMHSTLLTDFDNSFNLKSQRNGYIPISWIDGYGQQLPANSIVVTLEITALKNCRLSDCIQLSQNGSLVSEAYEVSGRNRDLVLEWVKNVNQEGQTYSISPNPSPGVFYISYISKSGEPVKVEVYDQLSRLVSMEDFDAVEGYNHWQIDLEQFGTGIYFVMANDEIVGKVLVQK